MGRFIVAVSLAHLFLFPAYVKLGAIQPWKAVDSIFGGGYLFTALMVSAALAPLLLGYLGWFFSHYTKSFRRLHGTFVIIVGLGGLLSLINGILIANSRVEQALHIPLVSFIGSNLLEVGSTLVVLLLSLTIVLLLINPVRLRLLKIGQTLLYIVFPLALFSITGVFYLIFAVNPAEASPKLDKTVWAINGPGNILILLFDALSYDSVFDKEGQVYTELPNIRSIVEDSTVFHNVPSYEGGTGRNVPIILTGTVYPKGGIYINDEGREVVEGIYLDSQRNIFDMVHEKGYPLMVFGYGLRYCTTYVQDKGYCKSTSPSEFNTQPDSFTEAFFEVYRLAIVRVLPTSLEYGIQDLLGIQSLTSTGKRVLKLQDEVLFNLVGPGFIYAHYPIPHVPYISLDPTTRQIRGSSSHLDSIQVVDFFLGEIKSRMVEVDVWNRTLLVIIADHHDGYVTQDPRTPFIIKLPGQTDRIDLYEEWSHKGFLDLLEREIDR